MCAEFGIGWFERDVDLAADGTVVVVHDSTLDRTTNKRGPVAALREADLAGIDAGSWFAPKFAGEPLPTLAQVVAVMNQLGLNANVEIKAEGLRGRRRRELVAGVARELAALEPERQVVISSFSAGALREYRRQNPGARLAYIFEPNRLQGLWRVVGAAVGAEALHAGHWQLTRKRVAAYARAGYVVRAWTVNDPARGAELAEWGVSAVFSDRPQDFPPAWRG